MFYDIPVYHYDTHVVYISPDNNSDKEFEEQIFMGIKSRNIVSNMTIYIVHINGYCILHNLYIHCVR